MADVEALRELLERATALEQSLEAKAAAAAPAEVDDVEALRARVAELEDEMFAMSQGHGEGAATSDEADGLAELLEQFGSEAEAITAAAAAQDEAAPVDDDEVEGMDFDVPDDAPVDAELAAASSDAGDAGAGEVGDGEAKGFCAHDTVTPLGDTGFCTECGAEVKEAPPVEVKSGETLLDPDVLARRAALDLAE